MKTKVERPKRALTDAERDILERICESPQCWNRTARGYIYCERCLHGSPVRADDEAINLKRRLQRQGLL